MRRCAHSVFASKILIPNKFASPPRNGLVKVDRVTRGRAKGPGGVRIVPYFNLRQEVTPNKQISSGVVNCHEKAIDTTRRYERGYENVVTS